MLEYVIFSDMNNEIYQQLCISLEGLRSAGNPYWNAGPATIELLIRFIEKIPQCRVLEIGTSNGYTALRLVPVLNRVNGTLVTIESNGVRGDLAEHHMKTAGVSHMIRLIRGHAPEVFSEFTGTFDIVFLDATKYEHEAYVKGLIPYLRVGSVIVADNVLSHHHAMDSFVRYMQESPLFSTELVSIETGVLVSRVISISSQISY